VKVVLVQRYLSTDNPFGRNATRLGWVIVANCKRLPAKAGSFRLNDIMRTSDKTERRIL